ncbi:DUF2637 domain-containing protein [Streptosporangium sp. NBC_01756]|uniref:DUF2637 domain-containing protein n=1 Tax=Streptosporangium sp. NBC_01756 TaxID=2975950 RepID=UPI002DD824C9|nr:DUF2637 domain-containing protein [Streptosporangium sp. NBC_01756]WSC90080.1 DUF2637 domain-containing protein [Streptosporangium sp. NBC_01756]
MIRFATTVVVLLLAAVAAVVSYRHAYEVVVLNGESGLTAYLVPLTIDGAIFASSMVLLDAARRGLPVPALARWTLALGILATLAANVAHGWAHGPVGAIVAAWPAVALVLSYELLMGMIRRGVAPEGVSGDTLERIETPPAAEPGTADAPVDVPPVEPVPAAPALSPAPMPVLTPAPDELFPVAADRYATEIAEGQAPALSRLKRELRIGQPRAAKVKAYLDQLAEAKPTSVVRGQNAVEDRTPVPAAPSRKITEDEEALRVMDLAVKFTKENPPTEADLEADGLDETAKFIVRKAWNMPDPKRPAEDVERPWDGPWGDEPTDEELTAGMTPAEVFAGPPIKVLRQQWREREWRNRTAAMNGHSSTSA